MARIKRAHEEFVDDYEVPDELLEQIENIQKRQDSIDRVFWIVPAIAAALAFFDLTSGAHAVALAGFGYLFVTITRWENRAVHAAMLARKDIAGLRRKLAHARAQLTEIESKSH